jgi:hypothetical protein
MAEVLVIQFGARAVAKVITPRVVKNGDLYGIPNVERVSTMPPAVSAHPTALMVKPILVSHAKSRPTVEVLDILLVAVPMKKSKVLFAINLAAKVIQAMVQSVGRNALLARLLVVVFALTTQVNALAMSKALLTMCSHWQQLLLVQL